MQLRECGQVLDPDVRDAGLIQVETAQFLKWGQFLEPGVRHAGFAEVKELQFRERWPLVYAPYRGRDRLEKSTVVRLHPAGQDREPGVRHFRAVEVQDV